MVCPSCGVPVVSGYVKCPKCHAALPLGRAKTTTKDPGGTALPQRARVPITPVIAAVGVAVVVALVFGAFGAGERRLPARPGEPVRLRPDLPLPRAGATPAPVDPRANSRTAPAGEPAALDAATTAGELERSLQRRRLWSTVEAIGGRVDIRSGACGDPGMASAIEAARTALRSAGLTRLRCLEQSGRVVIERDL